MAEPAQKPLRLRVAGVLLIAVLVALVPSVVVGKSIVDRVEEEIGAGQLRLARLSAVQADRILMAAFTEIEQIASEVVEQPDLQSGAVTFSPFVATTRGAGLTRGLVLIGPDAAVLAAGQGVVGTATVPNRALEFVAGAADRAVSEPWIDPTSGRPQAALSVPIYEATGERVATLVGILDLTEPIITDLIQPAAELGSSGHADLVDERGVVLASTQPDHVLNPGDHPHFYERMAAERRAVVDRVVHLPGLADLDRSDSHLMAYAPLRIAPWGVAMGASEEEVLDGVRDARRLLLLVGIAGAVALLTGAALAIRLIRE